MKRVVGMGVGVLLGLCLPAVADPAAGGRQSAPSAYMRVFGPAYPPFGFVQFCQRMPGECAPDGGSEARFEATAERLSELDDVNRLVNRNIKPATDLELYGVAEHWTLPVDRGDCEDYALLKRHLLIRRGWPVNSLLLTVVRDEIGEGHAILTARTAQGDFILDNKVPDILPWYHTRYRFIMRQSYVDPLEWKSLDPGHAPRPAPQTSIQRQR